MKNIKQIAQMHTNLWKFHDLKKWDKLNSSALEIVKLWGYPLDVAKKVAPKITMTFKLADKAEEARLKKDFKKESEWYEKTRKEFEEIYNILGASIKPAVFKVQWIFYSRHKNKLGVFINLFMEHFYLVPKNPFKALQLTLIASTDIYPAHNNHDWNKLTDGFTKYWKKMPLTKSGKSPPQF